MMGMSMRDVGEKGLVGLVGMKWMFEAINTINQLINEFN